MERQERDSGRLPGLDWLGNDNWLASPTAVKFFLISTIFVVASIPLAEGWIDITKTTLGIRLPLTILAILGTIAILSLWIGMWLYWIRLDGSGIWAKRAWFFVLLVGFWYGAVPYYFFVYRPQVTRRARGER